MVALALWGGYSQEAAQYLVLSGRWAWKSPPHCELPTKWGYDTELKTGTFIKCLTQSGCAFWQTGVFLLTYSAITPSSETGPSLDYIGVISNILIYLKDKLHVQVLFYRSIPWSISQLEPTFFSEPHFGAGWLKANEFALNDIRTPFVDSLPQNRVE